MRSERVRRFFWIDIPLGVLQAAALLVVTYLMLRMGFDTPVRATLMLLGFMFLIILIVMYFTYRSKYRRLCLEESGASHSNGGTMRSDYLNGRMPGKIIFWCVAIGIVLPVLQFMLYYILLMPVLLIDWLIGGFSVSGARVAAVVNMVISAIAAIAGVVYLWNQFKKSFPPLERGEPTDLPGDSA